MAQGLLALERIDCFICTKENRGILRCEGCLKTFCMSHIMEHRQELAKTLENMEYKRDLVQQSLLQYMDKESVHHPLLADINRWKNSSIEKIHAIAEEARENLLKITSCRTNDLNTQLKDLTDKLRQSRVKDDFLEADLEDWKRRLTELDDEVKYLVTLRLHEDPFTPLIQRIAVEYESVSECFQQTSGHVNFQENGRIVVKDSTNGYTEVRGKREYRTGNHTLIFRIEKLDQGGWIFIGINSKAAPLQQNSWNASSSYGWQNHGYSIRAGSAVQGQGSEAIQNDRIKIVLDCDQQLLFLTNERINQTYELQVDTDRCPFPWQTHLNLYQSRASIRILPE